MKGARHCSSQVQQAIRMRLGLAAPPSPHDVADALALAIGAADGAANGGGRS